MLLVLGVFVVWLALQGRLKVYADFVTSGPGLGGMFATAGAPTSTTVGPVTVTNTQSGISTGQAVINNIAGAISHIFGGPGNPAGTVAPPPTGAPGGH